MNALLVNLERLHITKMGVDRIRKNCHLNMENVVDWCKSIILLPDANITQKGKNWYITAENYIITVNANSYTIITAHTRKN